MTNDNYCVYSLDLKVHFESVAFECQRLPEDVYFSKAVWPFCHLFKKQLVKLVFITISFEIIKVV